MQESNRLRDEGDGPRTDAQYASVSYLPSITSHMASMHKRVKSAARRTAPRAFQQRWTGLLSPLHVVLADDISVSEETRPATCPNIRRMSSKYFLSRQHGQQSSDNHDRGHSDVDL